MSDVAAAPLEPPRAHARVVYLGPVAPHWEIHSDFGDRQIIEEFRGRVLARLVLLPPHDPQFRRNRERVIRDAERENILLDWDLGLPEEDERTRLTPASGPVGTLAAMAGAADQGATGLLDDPRQRRRGTSTASSRGSTSTSGCSRWPRTSAVPLLERAKFLAIFSQNLDEFFQVRVAGLKEQVAAGLGSTTPDGRTPGQQLLEVRDRVERLVRRQQRLFLDGIVPALAANGIRLSSWDELDDDDEKFLVETFEQRIFPVLTPLAVDPGHPFPYISNLSLNLAVLLRDPVTDERRFARVKVPDLLPRFVVMPDGERFVPLEQVIAAHLGQLFPGMEVESNRHVPGQPQRRPHPRGGGGRRPPGRRRDRAAPPPVRPRRAPRDRAPGSPTRCASCSSASSTSARTTPTACDGPLDLGGLWSVHAPRPARAEGPGVHSGCRPARLDNGEEERPDFFAVLREGDVLVHHPVRLLPHHRRGVHPAGVHRPPRARHQDDAVPHLGRQPDRAVAHPGGRARQAGGRARRAQGPLRRGGQHRVGQGARDGGRARRLRARGAEGPHEDRARRARRARRHPALLPHRLRQLQLQDGSHLRGRRPAHRGPRHRRRPHPALQLPHRLRPRRPLPDAARVARTRRAAGSRALIRNEVAVARAGGAGVDHPEDEQPRRHPDDRRAVRRLSGRGRGRPHHPRHLLPASRAFPACPSTSGCGRSSVGTSSTAASTASPTATGPAGPRC